MNKCSYCGNEFEGNFCNQCGTEMNSNICVSCGNTFLGQFCNICGAKIIVKGSIQEHKIILTERSAIQGRLKTIATTSNSIILKKNFSNDFNKTIEISAVDIQMVIFKPYKFSMNPSNEEFGYITFILRKENSYQKLSDYSPKEDPYSISFGVFHNSLFCSLAYTLSIELSVELIDLTKSVIPFRIRSQYYHEDMAISKNNKDSLSLHLGEKEKRENRIEELDKQGIAYCPKCLSVSLSANKKGFGIGKAVLGAATPLRLFGLTAGNIGAKKVRITCLKCGYQFMAGKY